MRRLPLCLVVLLAAGCGGPPSPPGLPATHPTPVYVPRTAPATVPYVPPTQANAQVRPSPTKPEPTKVEPKPPAPVPVGSAVREQWKKDQEAGDKALYQGQPASFWIKLIHDKDATTRDAGEKALVAIGEPALPFLAEAIIESDKDAKIMARICFIEIRSKKGIEYLRQAIREAKPDSHKEIAFALAWLTRGDRSVLPDDDYTWAGKVLRDAKETEALGKLNERR